MIHRNCCLLVLCFVVLSSAWYNEPHMIVSEIAYKLSSKDIQAKVDKLIAVLASKYPKHTDYMTSGVWADDVKKTDYPDSASWHYIDLPYIKDNVPATDPYSIPNIVDQLNIFKKDFDVLDYNEKQAASLRFIIHFIGDIHMPLHAGALFSKQFPDSDHGGNLYYLTYNKKSYKLHAFVDSAGLLYNDCSSLPISKKQRSTVISIAEELSTLCSDDENFEYNPQLWANETFSNLDYIYTNVHYKETITTESLDFIHEMSKRQICIAGHRLAQTYKSLLDKFDSVEILIDENQPITNTFNNNRNQNIKIILLGSVATLLIASIIITVLILYRNKNRNNNSIQNCEASVDHINEKLLTV